MGLHRIYVMACSRSDNFPATVVDMAASTSIGLQAHNPPFYGVLRFAIHEVHRSSQGNGLEEDDRDTI
jgi:hypothetical protein